MGQQTSHQECSDCVRHRLRQRLERADRSPKQYIAKFATRRIIPANHVEVAIAYRTICSFLHRSRGHDMAEGVAHNGLARMQGLCTGGFLYEFSSEVLRTQSKATLPLFILQSGNPHDRLNVPAATQSPKVPCLVRSCITSQSSAPTAVSTKGNRFGAAEEQLQPRQTSAQRINPSQPVVIVGCCLRLTSSSAISPGTSVDSARHKF